MNDLVVRFGLFASVLLNFQEQSQVVCYIQQKTTKKQKNSFRHQYETYTERETHKQKSFFFLGQSSSIVADVSIIYIPKHTYNI